MVVADLAQPDEYQWSHLRWSHVGIENTQTEPLWVSQWNGVLRGYIPDQLYSCGVWSSLEPADSLMMIQSYCLAVHWKTCWGHKFLCLRYYMVSSRTTPVKLRICRNTCLADARQNAATWGWQPITTRYRSDCSTPLLTEVPDSKHAVSGYYLALGGVKRPRSNPAEWF
jgi:hypothetical protein